MSTEKGYNGWSNYETWCCKLWMDNDEGLYDMIQDNIESMRESDGREWRLANYIKDLVNELCPDFPSSMFSDLLSSAIQNIDFYEIAENLIDDWKAENPEEVVYADTESDND